MVFAFSLKCYKVNNLHQENIFLFTMLKNFYLFFTPLQKKLSIKSRMIENFKYKHFIEFMRVICDE